MRFNPHSPLLANELRDVWDAEREAEAVSIHIRHCWRMNYINGVGVALSQAVSIHIRHCWRMNYAVWLADGALTKFQSTFAIAGE